MKRSRTWFWMVVTITAALGSLGCAPGADDVKKRASKDLTCPESSIQVSRGMAADDTDEAEEAVTYLAIGCDKRATYRISGREIIKEK